MALNTTPGDPDADAYGELQEFVDWAAAFGHTLGTSTDTQREAMIRRGTALLDAKFGERWKGRRTYEEQSLAWPRSGIFDRDGVRVDDETIPRAIRNASFEVAMRELASPGSMGDGSSLSGSIKSTSVRVGPIAESITYAEGVTAAGGPWQQVENLLTGLIDAKGTRTKFLLRA